MEVEYSEVVCPADVIGVLVRKDNGINSANPVPEALMTKIGSGINKDVGP